MRDPPEDVKPVKTNIDRNAHSALTISLLTAHLRLAGDNNLNTRATTVPIVKLDTIDMNRVPVIPGRFDQINRLASKFSAQVQASGH
jgi:hypothetical protein